MMTSSIRSSRNVRLIPSVRDEWNVCVDSMASSSSMTNNNNAVMKYSRNENIHPCIHKELVSKFNRAPHSLRLDDQRVTYFNCELYTIPEDEVVCDSRVFDESVPVHQQVSLDCSSTTEAGMSKEFHAMVLQNERMIRTRSTVSPKAVIKSDTTKVVHSNELPVPCDFGNRQRSHAWDSEQFDRVLLQDLEEDNDCWENEFDENTEFSLPVSSIMQ